MKSRHAVLSGALVALLFVLISNFGPGTCLSSAGEPKGALSGFANSRTWSDSTGRFKIDAKLVCADDSEISLLKSDGKQVTIPLEKMSEADQTFINSFLTAEKALASVNLPGAGDDGDNPFAGGEPATEMQSDTDYSSDSLNNADAATGAPVDRKAILKGSRPLSIIPARAFWSVPALRGFPEVQFEDTIIDVSLPKPFFAKMQVMAAGKSGTVVANSYQDSRGRDPAYGKFVVANLSTGAASAVTEFEDPWKLFGLSPDASRAVAVRVEGFDKGNDLAIFRVVDQQLIPEFRFTAGGGSWDELHFAAFLPQNRLVTISQKHNLTVWDWATELVQRQYFGALRVERLPQRCLLPQT